MNTRSNLYAKKQYLPQCPYIWGSEGDRSGFDKIGDQVVSNEANPVATSAYDGWNQLASVSSGLLSHRERPIFGQCPE